jgi:hypothetical protein
VTADNKINNLTNKAEPKNVIDFLKKELNLSSKEAISTCQVLYKEQPLNVKKLELIVPLVEEDKDDVVNSSFEEKIIKDENVEKLREEKKQERVQKIRSIKKFEVKKKEQEKEKKISQTVRRGMSR